MRPLSAERPKVLFPVAGVPLVDHALGRLRTVVDDVAVNVHETQDQLVEHLESPTTGPVRISLERGEALGTAGALAPLRDWIAGRAVVVVNGDTWCPGSLAPLLDGWDGERIRILVPGGGRFGPTSPVAGALMPWRDVERLEARPTGLWEVSWRAAVEAGRVETVASSGPFHDCADPGDYLEANLEAAGGSFVGAGAVVRGTVEESVVWSGAFVAEAEHLHRAIRTPAGRTVVVRRRLRRDLVSDAPAG